MSELQHPDARSFDTVAALYERRRPAYPADAIRWLVEELRIDRSSVVLDLGAGTGKLTRALVPHAARVIAVEPGPAMLAELERVVPGAEPLVGAAEAIPLPDASVDAVTCGQSFHWFRPDEAVPEILRVLRPGGALGLIWNLRDYADEFQQEVTALLDPLVPPERKAMPHSVAALVERHAIGEVTKRVFPFHDRLDQEGVVERMASTSFVAAAPESERDEFLSKLQGAVARRGGVVAFRYTTEVYVVRGLGATSKPPSLP